MTTKTFFCLLASLLLLTNCGNLAMQQRLDAVEACMQDQPDSALALLRTIDTTKLYSRALQARYALLHATALDKNWIDTTDIGVVMPAVRYYDDHPPGSRRAKAWYYFGRIQENGGDFTSANISFLKAEKWAEGGSDKHFKSLIYQSLSNTYSETYLDEEALKYSEYSFLESSQIGDTLGMNASRYRMAQDLNNLRRYQEADSIYRFLISDKRISSHLWPSLLSDYALLLLLHKDDCGSAVHLFEEALKESGELQTRNHWGAYAYALLRTGNEKRAHTIFEQLEAVDDDKSQAYKSWQARADAFLGDYVSAYHHISRAAEIQRMNVDQVLRQSTFRVQKEYMEEEKKIMQLKTERQKILWTVIFVAILVATTRNIAYFRRKKRQILEEKESLLEAFRSLSTEYDHARDQRTIIQQQYIRMCQSHFEQMGRINELLYNSTNERETILYKELKKTVRNIRTDEKSHEEFEALLNESLDNVMIHFRETFPSKKARYYQLVSFLFAGFDAITISNILSDYSKENIYVLKTRLKKTIRETDCPYREQFLSLI